MEDLTKKKKLRIRFDSPVVLTFAILCGVVLILDLLTKGRSTQDFFCVYRAPLTDYKTYIRFFGHCLGHADLSHLINNMLWILLLGPILEEKYGSAKIVTVILVTALVTGIVEFLLFPNHSLLGASGVVFAFIMLAGSAGFRDNEVPVTFILVAIMYFGQEIYNGIFVNDNISQLTHILGGVVGTLFGILWRNKSFR